MKTKYIDLLDEILISQMNHWIFFPILLVLPGLMKESGLPAHPDVFLWMITGLIPLAMFFIRKYIKHFWLFILLNLVLLATSLIIPAQNTISRFVCIFACVCYFIYTFSQRLHNDLPNDRGIPPAVGIGISGAALFLQHYQELNDWDSYNVIILSIILGCYFLSFYLEKYLDFLTVNRSSAGHIPEKEMFRSGFGMAVLYTFAGMVIVLFSANVSWLAAILTTIKKLLVILLSFLSRLFPANEHTPYIPEAEELSQNGEMQLPEPGEAFWLWDVLMYVACIAVILLILYGLWKGLKNLIRYIRAHFNNKSIQKEKAEQNASVFDIHEKCNIIHESSRRNGFRNPFAFLNPTEKIRKYYKLKLVQQKKLLIPALDEPALGHFTAKEAADKLHCTSMAELYEKARYSNLAVTGDDAKQMKEVCKSR